MKDEADLAVAFVQTLGVGFGGQHSDMLEAWFAHVPGLKIVTPSNPLDALGLPQARPPARQNRQRRGGKMRLDYQS